MRSRLLLSTMVVVLTSSVATASLATGTAGAAPSKPPLKVMVISERSGPTPVDFMGDGATAAAKEINAAGGVDGAKIRLDQCDTKGDPNTAADCARRAAEGDYVALVAMWNNQEASVIPITDAAGLPNIGNFPLTPSSFTSQDAFPITGGSPFLAIGTIRAMQRAGAKTVSLVVPDVAAAGSAIIQILGKIVGESTVGEVVRVPVPTPELSPYVAKATEGVDGMIAGLQFDDNVRLVKTFDQSGSTVKLGLLTDDPEGIASELGSSGDGAIMANFEKPISMKDRAVKKFTKAMKAAGKKPTSQAEYGYASVYLFAQAAKGLPTVDRAGILQALNATTNFDIGLFAPIDFTKPQTAIPGVRIFNTELLAAKIKNSKVVSERKFFDATATP